MPDFGPWDAILILGVAGQATVIAYAHAPRWKAAVYAVPLPFTLATLALGVPVGTTHALSVMLMPFYPYTVRWLQGFMSAFPMLGVVAAYEARHSLWTLGRQVPIMMLALTPLLWGPAGPATRHGGAGGADGSASSRTFQRKVLPWNTRAGRMNGNAQTRMSLFICRKRRTALTP